MLIATRSRAASLRATLESMVRMDCAGVAWELVVVDNGSEDGTPELLREFEEKLPLRWSRVPDPGQNRARNSAIPHLRGRFTVLSDDDVVVAPDWLRQWYEGLRRWPRDSIFAGRITPAFPAGTEAWMSRADFPYRGQCFAAFEPCSGEGEYDGTPFGPNFAVRTAVLRRERFREDLGPAAASYAMGGETELVSRLRGHGLRVIYLPQPQLQHVLLSQNLTMEKLLRRGYNAGRGDEYRRAMRKQPTPLQMQLRLRGSLPLKIGFYAVRARLLGRRSQLARFRYAYKLHSARGRRDQLALMLGRTGRKAS